MNVIVSFYKWILRRIRIYKIRRHIDKIRKHDPYIYD
jgi:hypothetical protein